MVGIIVTGAFMCTKNNIDWLNSMAAESRNLIGQFYDISLYHTYCLLSVTFRKLQPLYDRLIAIIKKNSIFKT